jgi:hypothetical protein
MIAGKYNNISLGIFNLVQGHHGLINVGQLKIRYLLSDKVGLLGRR